MRLSGGRTGKRAVMIDNLELTSLMKPFDAEIWFGDRVAVLGSNGSSCATPRRWPTTPMHVGTTPK